MDFYQRVHIICMKIPYGKVASYGQIAMLCGKPKNSRQVGYALRTGKAGENVPAHRVVNSCGILSGAASFEYLGLQKLLLQEEGVEVVWTDKGWRVSMDEFGWKPILEEVENFLQYFGEVRI